MSGKKASFHEYGLYLALRSRPWIEGLAVVLVLAVAMLILLNIRQSQKQCLAM